MVANVTTRLCVLFFQPSAEIRRVAMRIRTSLSLNDFDQCLSCRPCHKLVIGRSRSRHLIVVMTIGLWLSYEHCKSAKT